MSKRSRKPFRLSFGTRSLSFTPLGTRYVVVCLLVGIAAVNSGSNLLYLVVSMMLSLMVVSGVLSEQALKGLRVARVLPDEIYAARPFPLRFKVRNTKKRIPSFALAVSEYYPGGVQSPGAFVLSLPAGSEGGGTVMHEVPARGLWVASGFEVATRFPFGFFQKTVRIPEEGTRTVYPRIEPIGDGLLKDLPGRLGERAKMHKGHGMEVRNLREYGPSDDARLIHWKSSARLARLTAKEFEAEEDISVTVVLDNLLPNNPAKDYKERFEDGVSLAAGAIRHVMFDLERPVSFVSRDRRIPAGVGHGHYIALMETLALIGPVNTDSQEDFITQAFDEGPAVFVLVERGTDWANRSAGAALVLEAGT